MNGGAWGENRGAGMGIPARHSRKILRIWPLQSRAVCGIIVSPLPTTFCGCDRVIYYRLCLRHTHRSIWGGAP